MDVTLESVSDMSSEAQIQLFDRLAELVNRLAEVEMVHNREHHDLQC